MSKKVNLNPKIYPFEECEESDYDCNECKYEGCNAWGVGFTDEDEENTLSDAKNSTGETHE